MKSVQTVLELRVPRTMTHEDIAIALKSFIIAGSQEWGVGWDDACVAVVSVKRAAGARG